MPRPGEQEVFQNETDQYTIVCPLYFGSCHQHGWWTGVRGVEARDIAETAPYFVLSCAPSPWPSRDGSRQQNIWLVQLFEDICAHVSVLAGVPAEKAGFAGFMNREQTADANGWSTGLAGALATCRVFVPLFSPSYFESEDCGKEWFAFTGRAATGVAHVQDATAAIIPALWSPVDSRYLPAEARSVQFDHADLGECYAANGFYGIIKRSKFRDDYRHAVECLARLIVRVSGQWQVAPGPVLDYASLVSAFGLEARSMPGGRPLRITIVAPRQGELPPGRGAPRYGPDARGWNPYAPDAARGLAEHASELARRLGYRPEIGDLNTHGRELLRGGRPSSPQVLIVDAWATTIDRYARLLRRVDAMDKPWVQVVVPWRRSEEEDEAVKTKLRSALAAALGRKLAAGRATSLSAVRGVPTLDDFSRVLPTVIMTAVRQYIRHAPPLAPAVARGAERPQLSPCLPDSSNTELPGA
jgi:FxsC-like protein